MTPSTQGKQQKPTRHPYLSGNFAPIQNPCRVTPCTYTGIIPDELLGGQYVRNGGNPVSNSDLGRDAHWFDGDGMLSGVTFTRMTGKDCKVQPDFTNQYILTDVLLSSLDTPTLGQPILPSITTLVNPAVSLFRICIVILRSFILVLLSHLLGSRWPIKKISVANTSIMYHDGRAMATCESGPPIRILLPSLETVGWFDIQKVDGEPGNAKDPAFGAGGLFGFMKKWTTAHPKVDKDTGEMILFHSNFMPPYVHYSVISATNQRDADWTPPSRLLNVPVPLVSSAKMMHDFGASKKYSVIMDLPLSLDPLQLVKNKPVISYDPRGISRFGIFPRMDPSLVRWFETKACCIFHVANTWDTNTPSGDVAAVNMLACRLTSAALIFAAGNIAGPKLNPKDSPFSEKYTDQPVRDPESLLIEITSESTPLIREQALLEDECFEEDQCRLYFYSFSVEPATSNHIIHEFSLSSIPFEFPSVSPNVQMTAAQYVYGCTTTLDTFGSALGRAVKVDALVKFNVKALIAQGVANPPPSITGCVDRRSVAQILESTSGRCDHIQIFKTPPRIFAQEPRFVPSSYHATEDAGYLLSYMFDESQLLPSGEPPPTAVSELWIIDARGMKDVLARIHLPQRVPYGMHGNWFPEEQILGQRPVENVRNIEEIENSHGALSDICRKTRNGLIRIIGG